MSMTQNPSQYQIKALKELGDIGAAHAVIGVSKLLNQRVDISVTNVDILRVNEIMDVFEGPESMVSVTCFEESEERTIGRMFLVFHRQEAGKLIELITGKPITGNRIQDEYDLSVLKEVGNIMCACYIHTLSTILKKKILHTVPVILQEKFTDGMSITTGNNDEELDYAMMLETQFEMMNGGIMGTLFFVSTSSCLDEIFKAIDQS
jgi:chemotaxis protein CheC